jgi:hypothetical protein
MHELVTVDFRNIDRHLGVGRPGGCKRKDGYQGNTDALLWHTSPPLKSQFFEKRPVSLPIWSTAWKNSMSAGGDGGRKSPEHLERACRVANVVGCAFSADRG